MVENSSNLIRLAYWRRRVISANTIGCGEGEALQKIRNALPTYSSRHRLFIFTGKRQVQMYSTITLDCHYARLKINYCLLPDPPNFSLLSTFN
jgi:hypothetical protein